MSAGTDGKADTGLGLKLCGALQGCHLRLAQHLRELDGPLRTDVVVVKTVCKGCAGEKRERAGMS